MNIAVDDDWTISRLLELINAHRKATAIYHNDDIDNKKHKRFIKIMLFRKKVALVITVIFVGLIIDDYISVSNGPKCSEMTFEQVSKSVYDDYLERLERWERDVKILGTRKPVLAFEKNEYQNDNTYLLPFTAQGPAGKTMRFAILTCKTGYIEYSEQ